MAKKYVAPWWSATSHNLNMGGNPTLDDQKVIILDNHDQEYTSFGSAFTLSLWLIHIIWCTESKEHEKVALKK